MIIHLVAFLLNLVTSGGELPAMACSRATPFKNKDNKCSNFMQICAKTDDADCQSFVAACEQCPPSSITDSLLMTLSNQCKNIQNVVQLVKNQTAEDIRVLSSKSDKSSENIINLLIAILIILCIVGLIILAELRFKLITKCINRMGNKGDYRLLESRKEQLIKNLLSKLENSYLSFDQTTGVLKTDFERKLDIICEKIKLLHDEFDTISSQLKQDSGKPKSLIKFMVLGQVIELHVYDDQSIVKVKRLICHELQNISQDTYKVMKLKYKGAVLDDNRYLLDCVKSRNVEVHCEIDKFTDANDIVVLKIQGSEISTNLIQIQKHRKIKELKQIISNNSISIFKETVDLADDLTVEQCNLMDNDLIEVIERKHGTMFVYFILGDEPFVNIAYSNVDKVSSLEDKIRNASSLKTSQFYLYSDVGYMAADRLIFDYIAKSPSVVKCVSVKSMKEIKLDKVRVKGSSSEIFSALDLTLNKAIFLRKFQFESISRFLEGNALLNELSKIFVTKPHRTFGRVYGFYIDGNVLYVEIDYLKSMSRLVKEEAPFKESDIAKWSKQILEGLKYLHDNNIVYRDLKASDILLDDDRNIVISGFGLSKYLLGSDANEIIEELVRTNVSSFTFTAPEVMNDQPFGKWTDVWSFGVLLLNIVTGKSLYNYHKGNIMEEITKYENIECESSDVQPEIKSFIDSCLKGQPKDRSTVTELLENKFIKKYN